MTTRTFSLTGLYAPPPTPVMVDVPALTCLMVDGRGDPWSSPAWTGSADALRALAVAVTAELGVADGPMPLEALFHPDGSWTLLVVQPAAARPDVVARARARLAGTPDASAAASARRERLHEGWAAQVLQVGTADARRSLLDRLAAFVEAHGYAPSGPRHEIYLDGVPTPAESRRTVIRQPVVPAS